MVLTEIAKEFHKSNAEVAFTITLTLAMRPVGAFLFALMADQYGRRIPLMTYLQARFAAATSYSNAMALTALLVFACTAVVISLGPEKKGIVFGGK